MTKQNALETLRLAHKYDISILTSTCVAVLEKALPDLALHPTEIEPYQSYRDCAPLELRRIRIFFRMLP
jgi:hypothetical protein